MLERVDYELSFDEITTLFPERSEEDLDKDMKDMEEKGAVEVADVICGVNRYVLTTEIVAEINTAKIVSEIKMKECFGVKVEKPLVFPRLFIEACIMDIVIGLNGLGISAEALQSSYLEEETIEYVEAALKRLVESGWLEVDPSDTNREKHRLSEAGAKKMANDRNCKKFW